MAISLFRAIPLLLLVALSSAAAQQRRFPEVERRHDAVVLVADVASGRIIGGIRADLAFEQRYHPASLFKIPLAELALRSGAVSKLGEYRCTGRDTVGGRVDRCWRPEGHGVVDMEMAIAHSCNLYFRALARSLSRQEILQSARRLGMLSASGFPGSTEKAVTPVLNESNILGEAFVVSPAQMLRMSLILASRRVTAGARFDRLHRGMALCVSKGTAHDAWRRSPSIAGKTGTDMETGQPGRSVGWFIGYAPAERPRYAVVVLLKNGRGSGAAAVAGEIFESLR